MALVRDVLRARSAERPPLHLLLETVRPRSHCLLGSQRLRDVDEASGERKVPPDLLLRQSLVVRRDRGRGARADRRGHRARGREAPPAMATCRRPRALENRRHREFPTEHAVSSSEMASRDKITSAFAPDLEEVRAWLLKMIAALRFVELIAAVVALLGRMRDINTELVSQLAHLRRRRPRSEALRRLERQLVLPLAGLTVTLPSKTTEVPSTETKKSRKGRHPGRAAPPAHLPRIPVFNRVPAELRVCPQCGTQMTTVSHSSCLVLNVIPARVVVEERLDETVACPNDDTIVRGLSAAADRRARQARRCPHRRGRLRQVHRASAHRAAVHPLRAGGRRTSRRRRSDGVSPRRSTCSPRSHDSLKSRRAHPACSAPTPPVIPVLDPEAPEGIRNGPCGRGRTRAGSPSSTRPRATRRA